MNDDHRPVLAKEVINGLAIKPNGIYVDATFGRGGHSQLILNQLGLDGRLIALDKDPDAVKAAKKALFIDSRFQILHSSFAHLQQAVNHCGFQQVDGVLMDLGVSSPQLDNPLRGFSFMKTGPLDMRMNPEQGMDAATWINQASAEEIANVLYRYGEEKNSRRIAAAIVEARSIKPIATTTELAQLIQKASPSRDKKKHPATQSFQAIRIFINKELEELTSALSQARDILKMGGRLAVISFHSLEDRMVKQFIHRESLGENLPERLPIKHRDIKRRLKKIDGLIKPTAEEIKINPRARSARLRVAEKIT